jgi:hypothetical protein
MLPHEQKVKPRLMQETEPLGHPKYTLAVQP